MRACSNSVGSRCTPCVHQPLCTTLQASMCPCHCACAQDAWERSCLLKFTRLDADMMHACMSQFCRLQMHTMYAPTSMHNTAGQCVPMPLCVCPGRVGKHMPTYFHTLICGFDARVHVAIP